MIAAKFFKWVFNSNLTRRYYYGIYKLILKPLNLFKGKTVICNYDNVLKMKVDLDDWIQQNVYFFGNYDTKNITFIKTQLKVGDIFFDIGANVGCFSLSASVCVGATGKVYAFEPVKKVYARLCENITLNNIENILAYPKAVNFEDTKLKLYVGNQSNLGTTSIQEHDSMSGEVVEVDSISLDGFVSSKNISKVDFVKIDIEGAEKELFSSNYETWLPKVRCIVIELHDNLKPGTSKSVFRTLDRYHFSFSLQNGSMVFLNEQWPSQVS